MKKKKTATGGRTGQALGPDSQAHSLSCTEREAGLSHGSAHWRVVLLESLGSARQVQTTVPG